MEAFDMDSLLITNYYWLAIIPQIMDRQGWLTETAYQRVLYCAGPMTLHSRRP